LNFDGRGPPYFERSDVVPVLFGSRDLSLLLKLTIGAALEESVETGTFGFHPANVRQFSLQSGAKLVTAVARNADLLAVVRFDFHTHGLSETLIRRVVYKGTIVWCLEHEGMWGGWVRRNIQKLKKTALDQLRFIQDVIPRSLVLLQEGVGVLGCIVPAESRISHCNGERSR
jgi:hypothetical protein